MERKIAGERGESECKRGEIGGCGEGILGGFFKNILNVFCFLSLSLLLRKIQLPPRGSQRAPTQGRPYEEKCKKDQTGDSCIAPTTMLMLKLYFFKAPPLGELSA